jgi:hypothetical protein
MFLDPEVIIVEYYQIQNFLMLQASGIVQDSADLSSSIVKLSISHRYPHEELELFQVLIWQPRCQVNGWP